MKRLMVMSSLVVAVACGSGKPSDPFAADMKMICNAGGHFGASGESVMALREIAGKLRTPDAARLLAAVAQVAPAERAALIKPALAKAGLTRCTFLD